MLPKKGTKIESQRAISQIWLQDVCCTLIAGVMKAVCRLFAGIFCAVRDPYLDFFSDSMPFPLNFWNDRRTDRRTDRQTDASKTARKVIVVEINLVLFCFLLDYPLIFLFAVELNKIALDRGNKLNYRKTRPYTRQHPSRMGKGSHGSLIAFRSVFALRDGRTDGLTD